MPVYLYAMIGALIFAIVHGMHFTVGPLQHEAGVYVRHITLAAPRKPGRTDGSHPDIRIAETGY